MRCYSIIFYTVAAVLLLGQPTLIPSQKSIAPLPSSRQVSVASSQSIKPPLPTGPRPKNIKITGKKGVIGSSVPQDEQLAVTQAQQASEQEISDTKLTAVPFSDDEAIEAPPSLLNTLKEKFNPVREKLSAAGETLAAKQDVLQEANNLLSEQRAPFSFEFPYLGKGYFGIQDSSPKGLTLQITFKKNGRETLKVNPVILNNMKLEYYEGQLRGPQLHKDDTVTIFGEEATFRLKKVELKEGSIISKTVFEVLFKTPLQKNIPFIDEPLIIKGGYLTLSSATISPYPITLAAQAMFRGQKIRVMLLYAPQNKLTAALQIKKMPLQNLIPPVGDTPLKNMNITEGTVYVDLWVPKVQYGEEDIRIPEDEPTRSVRISATLDKIEELPIDDAIEDISPEEIKASLDDTLQEEIETSVKEDATKPLRAFPTETDESSFETTNTHGTPEDRAKDLIQDEPSTSQKETPEIYFPSEGDYSELDFAADPSEPIATEGPDLVLPGEIDIDPSLIDEITPDCDYAEPADGSADSELIEEQLGPQCDPTDICCREKNEAGKIDLQTSFYLEAILNRYQASIAIGGSDFVIPHVGPISNATIQLQLSRTAQLREDTHLRQKLKQKTLKAVDSFLSIDVSCVPIREIGFVENGNITISLNRSEREKGKFVYSVNRGALDLTGRMRLKFGPLGKLPLDVTATITRKGLIFTGMLDFCQQYEELLETSDTGYETYQKRCLKNTLTYGGLTLENVKVTYGYPRYTAPELQVREATTAMRQELRAMATDRRRAAREVRFARENGETPDAEQLKLASSKIPSPNVIKKPDERKQLSLIGTFTLWGLRFITTLSLQPDPKNPKKRKLGFSARGVIKDFQPFKYIPGAKNIPGLKDVTFGELSAEIRINTVRNKPKPSLTLKGSALLFGMLLRANLKFVTSKKGVPGVFIYTTPQRQQSLTDIIPVLSGAFFKEITCCNSTFALSSVSEIDPAFLSEDEEKELAAFNIERIRRGCLFVANVPFTGTLEPIGKWLGINKELTPREKELAQAMAQELAEARARGEKVPAKDLCSTGKMFRILGNINLQKPALSEFRIGIGSKELRQFSSTEAYTPQPGEKERNLNARLQTGFSDAESSVVGTSKDVSTRRLKTQLEKERAKAAKPQKPVSEQDKREEPMVELDQVEIFFLGDVISPRAGVAAGLIVRPTPEELLRLKGSVEFSPKDVTIGAQMLGTWHNAFTLSGWDLSNVSFMLGFIYGSVLPTRLGGSAFLNIHKQFDAGFKFLADPDITSMGFEGNISRFITFFDIIDIFLKATKFPLPEGIKKMPMPLEIRDVYVRYAPKDLRVGDQMIERGFALKAKVSILKKQGAIDISIDDNGLKGFGTLEQINVLNLLKITSSDGKGDPKIDIELSMDRQNFLITGLINIANLIQQSSFVEISSDGFKFQFISAIGPTMWHDKPLLESNIKGETSGTLNDPQFTLAIDFQQNLLQFIKEQANEKLGDAQRAIEQQLGEAQRTIEGISTVISDADHQIAEARRRVTDARNAVQKIGEARKASAQKFKDAQDKVATIRNEIKELDQWYQSLPVA